SKVSGGRMVGSRLASIDFPVPGGPISSLLYADQLAKMTWHLEIMGFDVVAAFIEVVPANGNDEDQFQIKLGLAAFKAKAAGAVLVARSTNRFIRSFGYHPKTNPDALPNVLEFDRFLDLLDGAKLATLWHPDLSEKQVRELES